MTSLDRAARAIASVKGWAWDSLLEDAGLTDRPSREGFREDARAALNALREPSTEMAIAGGNRRTFGMGAREIWQAMIDVALMEKSR